MKALDEITSPAGQKKKIWTNCKPWQRFWIVLCIMRGMEVPKGELARLNPNIVRRA